MIALKGTNAAGQTVKLALKIHENGLVERLRYHVTGAIARGEAAPIVERRA